MINQQDKEQLLALFEELTEEQFLTLKQVLKAFTEKKTPEQKEQEEAERKEREEARHKQYIDEKEKLYNNLLTWKNQKMQGFTVPEDCDYTIGEVEPVLELMTYINPDGNAIFTGCAAMFDYGFKKGTEYATRS